MKLSPRIFVPSTALLCTLILGGCAATPASNAENAPEGQQASASVSPGTITITSPNASPNPSESVTPGDITVMNPNHKDEDGSSSEDREDSADGSVGSSNGSSNSAKSSSGSSGTKKSGEKGEQSNQKGGSKSSSRSGGSSKSYGSSSSQHSGGGSGSDAGAAAGSDGGSHDTGEDAGSGDPPAGNDGAGVPSGPVGECTDTNISVSLTPGATVGGSQLYTLTFANISNAACLLKGNPSVAHTNIGGNQIIGLSSQPDKTLMNPAGVVLQPGESTTASMKRVSTTSHGDICGVRNSQKLTVWLPASGSGYAFDFDTDTCANVPQLFVGQFGA